MSEMRNLCFRGASLVDILEHIIVVFCRILSVGKDFLDRWVLYRLFCINNLEKSLQNNVDIMRFRC